MRAVYSEYRVYSPVSDAQVVRISMADERGAEYWIQIQGEGAGYRRAHSQALTDLMEAIEMGMEPGEVLRS